MSATANQASRLDGFGRAKQMFAEAGLAEPPIPNRFRSRIRVEAPWCFATRTVNAMEMYFFQHYPAELLTGAPRDYIAISHAGHGANSYAINYHLVDGVIAVFAQIGWGGAYGDASESARRVNDLFRSVAQALAAVETARSRWLKSGRGRLVLIESDLRGLSSWGWLDQPLHHEAIPARLETRSTHAHATGVRGSAIDQATNWLTAAG